MSDRNKKSRYQVIFRRLRSNYSRIWIVHYWFPSVIARIIVRGYPLKKGPGKTKTIQQKWDQMSDFITFHAVFAVLGKI
jgi:hypothetical protein